MRYVLFDLGSLSFGISPEGSTLSVRSTDRVLLGSTEIPAGMSTKECAFRLLDDILSRGTLATRDGAYVAFYNPHTAEVSVGATPRTVVLSAGETLNLPACGMDATLDGGELVLADGTRLVAVDASPQRLVGAFTAHG
jgi:hypothetical protein